MYIGGEGGEELRESTRGERDEKGRERGEGREERRSVPSSRSASFSDFPWGRADRADLIQRREARGLSVARDSG